MVVGGTFSPEFTAFILYDFRGTVYFTSNKYRNHGLIDAQLERNANHGLIDAQLEKNAILHLYFTKIISITPLLT